jgi:HAD superfamily hydrolase (TIGR01549 family)
MLRRLVLFDIDGTLLKPCGLGRRSLDRAFESRFGHAGVSRGLTFHGRTDPDILADCLAAAGAPQSALEEMLQAYLRNLEEEVSIGPSLTLPGVEDLLLRLQGDERVTLGLVTGNVRRGARIKLDRDALWPFFEVGAFGDERRRRGELIELARARAEAHRGRSFPWEEVFYVGDTEADVEAAKEAGARCVAVATGVRGREDLARVAPEHLLDSLHPPASFLEVVLS